MHFLVEVPNWKVDYCSSSEGVSLPGEFRNTPPKLLIFTCLEVHFPVSLWAVFALFTQKSELTYSEKTASISLA